MRTDIHALGLFLKVAEMGSFSAAAAVLNMTPAAVSQSIRRLEQRYGVKLFHRTTRSMSLTPAGELLQKQADAPMQAIAELDHLFEEEQGVASGPVRISAPLFFSRQYLLPALADLQQHHPKLTFHIDASDQKRDLTADPIDLVIRIDKPTEFNLIARPVVELRTVTAASHQYLKQYGEPLSPENLTQHKCIAYRFPGSGLQYEWQFKDGNRIASFLPPEDILFNDPQVCCDAAAMHMGMLQIADIILKPYLDDGRVKEVLSDYSFRTRTLYLCYSGRQFNPLRLKVTIEFLVERFKALFNN